jgi:hypothetical protein
MVRYFYAWTPLVLVGAVVLLSLPWLGLIAFVIAALAAVAAPAALVWATVAATRGVGRTIALRLHRPSAVPQYKPALLPAERDAWLRVIRQ